MVFARPRSVRDGSRDPHYDQVKQINFEIKAIGDVLGACESIAVFQHGEGATIKTTDTAVAAMDGKLTIGVFKHRIGGNLFALVTNRDYKSPARAMIRVQPEGAKVERFDPRTREWSTVDSQPMIAPLDTPPGDGVLLRW